MGLRAEQAAAAVGKLVAAGLWTFQASVSRGGQPGLMMMMIKADDGERSSGAPLHRNLSKNVEQRWLMAGVNHSRV